MDTQEISNIIKKALKIRLKQKIQIDETFCILDMAKELGIEVKFVGIKSLEGAYLKETHTILLSTFRPEGRIRFTCAHELGHFIFQHGDSFDELVDKGATGTNKREEKMCDIFASFLLMPETTVNSFFHSHDWSINSPNPSEIYAAANWLGASYSSLLNHLYFGLKKIDKRTFDNLVKIQPKNIKSSLSGRHITSNLLIVDSHWKGRPIDMQIGDYLLLAHQIDNTDGILTLVATPGKFLYQANRPGLSFVKIQNDNGGLAVRVRRNEYVGRSIFRHLGED